MRFLHGESLVAASLAATTVVTPMSSLPAKASRGLSVGRGKKWQELLCYSSLESRVYRAFTIYLLSHTFRIATCVSFAFRATAYYFTCSFQISPWPCGLTKRNCSLLRLKETSFSMESFEGAGPCLDSVRSVENFPAFDIKAQSSDIRGRRRAVP